MWGLFTSGKKKTIRPVQKHKEGTNRYKLHTLARTTLGSGDIQAAVRLPAGEDLNEWLAANVVDIYNDAVLIFSLIDENVTREAYPTMHAGPSAEYLWQDGQTYKKPTRVPARDYVELLLAWVEALINDETVFPTTVDQEFPADFQRKVGKVFRRLFRLYAFIYTHKEIVDEFKTMKADRHLNSVFKHFCFFCKEFNLIPDAEFGPVRQLVDQMSREAAGGAAGGGGAAAAPAAAPAAAQ